MVEMGCNFNVVNMEKKQTVVEWLQEALEGTILTNEQIMQTIGLFEQAKDMEKEHIIDAFLEGADMGEMFNNENRAFISDAEQYYKETFKSE